MIGDRAPILVHGGLRVKPKSPPAPIPTANSIRLGPFRLASTEYVQTMSETLIGQTILDERDADGSVPLSSSTRLARTCWPGETALGRRVDASPVTARRSG
jgi:hypothetical protein